MLTEIQTRPIPYEQIEVVYARNRPYNERPLIPEPGDAVYFRAEYWDQYPWQAIILSVQDLNDRTDPHLWLQARDVEGEPIYDNGLPRYYRVPDPWPLVELQYTDPSGRIGLTRTRESRMRGSPGWLPLNWRSRPVRLPSDLLAVERPRLKPVNVSAVRFYGSTENVPVSLVRQVERSSVSELRST